MSIKWHVKNWFRVGKEISWKLNMETIGTLLYFCPVFKNDLTYKIVQKKHEFVFNFLKKNYPNILNKYKNLPNTKDLDEIPQDRKIWVMWWQGEENAPSLVKHCIDSIRRNANGAEVIIITKNNFKQYADIPDYIIEKNKKGILSFAQLSDIMRIFLLSKWGGLWLDATIYVSKPIPKEIFKMQFYTQHTSLKKTPFVQNDRIHCFIMGGIPNSKILLYAREFFTEYWKEHNVVIDYYFLDYMLMLAYWNFDDIHKMIDDLPYTSETLYSLVNELSHPYCKETLDKILEDNLFSKLNWHKEYPVTKKSVKTNYAVLFHL